jgi:hypothetical protein
MVDVAFGLGASPGGATEQIIFSRRISTSCELNKQKKKEIQK